LAAAIHGLVIRAAQQARVPGKPEPAAGRSAPLRWA
jgi:hypothetical protein